MTIIAVHVEGIQRLEQDLSPQQFEEGLRVGLSKAGNRLIREARILLEPHKYTGRYAQQMHTVVTGSGFNQMAHVGVIAGQVPEARPLEYGWRSESGKQPPTDAIARWLTSKPEIISSVSSSVSRNSQGFVQRSGTVGGIAGESAVRGLAFVIARKIGRSGYKFGKLELWPKAFAVVRPELSQILRTALVWRGKHG